MLMIIAAVLFGLAFILNAASANGTPIFTAFSFMLAGLACMALHLAGIGTNWRWRR